MMDIPKKKYDLEDRTLKFAKDVRMFIASIEKKVINFDDCKQLLRSSGSVGANYIEANEALSKKDFLMRVKICRKEAKESVYWLELLLGEGEPGESEALRKEARELTNIFGAIVRKAEGSSERNGER
jgi:four helix bundle protein